MESDVILLCAILCATLTFVLLPEIKSTACDITGAITVKHSLTALHEPGRLMINVFFRIPDTALRTQY